MIAGSGFVGLSSLEGIGGVAESQRGRRLLVGQDSLGHKHLVGPDSIGFSRDFRENIIGCEATRRPLEDTVSP